MSPQKADVSRGLPEKKSNKQASKGVTIARDNKEGKKDKKETDKKEDRKVASEDDTFRAFQRVCKNVADNDAYTDKTAIIRKMFIKGAHGGRYPFIVISLRYTFTPCFAKKIE